MRAGLGGAFARRALSGRTRNRLTLQQQLGADAEYLAQRVEQAGVQQLHSATRPNDAIGGRSRHVGQLRHFACELIGVADGSVFALEQLRESDSHVHSVTSIATESKNVKRATGVKIAMVAVLTPPKKFRKLAA